MNKNAKYYEFVEELNQEVQRLTKDWEADVIFQPATGPDTDDCLVVEIPSKDGKGVQRFHVEEIYRDLMTGDATMKNIVEEVGKTLDLGYRVSGLGILDDVNCYEKIRGFLILRPFNYDANTEKLENGIFYQIGDIALALYVNIGNMEEKYVSSMVNSELLSIWEKKKDEVIETAIRNTYRLFPPRVVDVSSSSFEVTENQEFMQTVPDIFKTEQRYCIFLSTENCINGAIAVFMPGVAKRLGDLIGNDFYIGFLSTEAAVIHNRNFISPGMVREGLRFQRACAINDDFLSEKVFLYSRERDQIELVE